MQNNLEFGEGNGEEAEKIDNVEDKNNEIINK